MGKHLLRPGRLKKIIKEKLNVDMKGEIVACHRLRNRKRVLVKFQDYDDRDAVYEAKFGQGGEYGERIAIHENLTEKRAKMITLLEEMRKKQEVLNYHTKNGNIMARNCATKRYSRIQSWYSLEEIRSTLRNAAPKTNNQTNNHPMHPQTHAGIPHGSDARKATNLEEYVVGTSRQTRQSRKGEGAASGK